MAARFNGARRCSGSSRRVPRRRHLLAARTLASAAAPAQWLRRGRGGGALRMRVTGGRAPGPRPPAGQGCSGLQLRGLCSCPPATLAARARGAVGLPGDDRAGAGDEATESAGPGLFPHLLGPAGAHG
jgi:hypothetical protein